MSLTARSFSKWIINQWQTWKDFLLELQLPVTWLVPSAESCRRRSRTSDSVDSWMLPEWSASAGALLALLARWCVTLRPESAAAARVLMDGVIAAAVPNNMIWWYGKSDEYGTEKAETAIEIAKHNVDITSLRGHSQGLEILFRMWFP